MPVTLTAGAGKTFLAFGTCPAFTSPTVYVRQAGDINTVENVSYVVCPFAGTVRNLRVRYSTGATTTGTVTTRKNATNQTLVASLLGGQTDAEAVDATHSFAVAAGDYLTLQGIRASGGNSVTILAASLEIDPS